MWCGTTEQFTEQKNTYFIRGFEEYAHEQGVDTHACIVVDGVGKEYPYDDIQKQDLTKMCLVEVRHNGVTVFDQSIYQKGHYEPIWM